MENYHLTPLCNRQPINGKLPITYYEWLHTDPGMRNTTDPAEPNLFILLQENTGNSIIPVIIADASEIKVREHHHA